MDCESGICCKVQYKTKALFWQFTALPNKIEK